MRALRILGQGLRAMAATIALVAIAWLSVQYCFHLRLLSVQTGSMVPTFRPGDGLIMRAGDYRSLRVGTVISYHSARNPKELVTHRLVRVNSTGFQTKGDRLLRPDPPVRASLYAGRVVAIVPGLGRALNWVHSWTGLIICVYVPSGAILAGELTRLEHHYRRMRPYRLPESQVI